jgi:hypothetical protein
MESAIIVHTKLKLKEEEKTKLALPIHRLGRRRTPLRGTGPAQLDASCFFSHVF